MTLPVAGWYDDPADAKQLRWWTGTTWSDARAQREAEPAAAPPVAPRVAPPVPAPPVIPPVPVPDAPLFAESSAPLPYGPAAVTGATGTPPSHSSPTTPPELPPFARPTAAATDVPAVPSVPAAPAAPAGPAPLSKFAQLRTANPLAFTGVLVGLLALLFNPLGGPGLLALILGIMGLLRANDLKRRGAFITGLTWAIVALALGGIAAVRVVAKLIGMAA